MGNSQTSCRMIQNEDKIDKKLYEQICNLIQDQTLDNDKLILNTMKKYGLNVNSIIPYTEVNIYMMFIKHNRKQLYIKKYNKRNVNNNNVLVMENLNKILQYLKGY